jgi:hypothetical protein
MAYDVSALAAYTKDNVDILIATALFEAKTQELIQKEGNVMPGIKSAERIQIMDTDAPFLVGGTCGWSASGTTTFTQRTITVGKLKVQEALCPKTLEAKVLQHKLPKGSQYQSVPFEQDYTERKAKKIAKQLETALWQGDTASADIYLKHFDGLLKLIDAGSPVNGNTGGVTVGTGITTSNVIAIVDAFWQAIPAAMKGSEKLRIFLGWEVFEKYVVALRNANLFHYDASNANGEIGIPGTQYKLTAVHGLDSTNRIIAFDMNNVYLGVDMLNEEDKFSIRYSEDNDEIRFNVEFKMGVNVGFTEEVIEFTLVP